MGKFYVTYWDGWQQGEPVVIHVPDNIDYDTIYPRVINTTVVDMTANYPEFDQTYTYITYGGTSGGYLAAMGFNLLDMSAHYNKKLYISENAYIQFGNAYNSPMQYVLNNSEVAVISLAPTVPAMTFLSVSKSQPDTHLAYIAIISPSATKFSCQTNGQAVDLRAFWAEGSAAPTDPYEQGGTSTTGGGTGNFDLSSDQIDIPNVPTLSAVDTGLVTLYTPTLAQLQDLARYLWNANSATIDWWKKLIANPLDLILGLSIVPVSVPAGATENVRVGLIDTGVAMTKAASQYVQVDCGALNVTEFYGAALDYLPFRKTSIYLPFIGTRTISTDDIMGKTVHVVYNIDLLSGALTAMIKCGDAVLYQYSGSCAMSIPLTGQTFTDMITSTIQLAAGIGATIASGGAAAGIVSASAANSVMSMKPAIERAGGVSGAAGQLAVMRPYLIGEIPRQSVPEHYNKYAGYPSNISAVLGDLSGYTEIETIHLSGINATKPELEEIETLLKGGVFI